MNQRQWRTKFALIVALGCAVLLGAGCANLKSPKSSKRGSGATPQSVAIGAGVNRELAEFAYQYRGYPYVWAGDSPKKGGFDCSGLVYHSAQKSLQLKLPRTAAEQAFYGTSIQLDQVQAGDLLFFNTSGQRFSHVGIYLSGTYFIHAPSAGGVVRIEDYTQDYWRTRFTGARRLP